MIVPDFDCDSWFDHDAIGMLEVTCLGRLQASLATADSMNSNRSAYYYVIGLSPSTSDLSFSFCRPMRRFLFIDLHLRQDNRKKLVDQRTSSGRQIHCHWYLPGCPSSDSSGDFRVLTKRANFHHPLLKVERGFG